MNSGTGQSKAGLTAHEPNAPALHDVAIQCVVAHIVTNWFAYILVLSLAFVVLKASNNILLQGGYLDPYFYTSYIQNYRDLASRYGLTYYSTRIAHLYPAGLAVAIFGSTSGYLVYRYVLLCVALGAVWSLARRHYSAPVAFAATAVAACHPWLLRSLFWDHYDSSGVVYLLLATAFLGSAAQADWRRLFLAGGAYALAANCNIFLAAVGAPLFFSYAAVHVRHVQAWIRLAAISFSGFLAFYLPLFVIHHMQFPAQGFFLDLVAIRVAGSMVTGFGRVWHHDVVQLVESGWAHLLVPAVALLSVGVLMIVRRGRQRPMHAALNLALVIILYLIVDFVFKVAVISLPYYFVYLFPPTMFCVVVIIGELADAVEPRKQSMILYGFGILSAVAYAIYPRLSPLIFRMNIPWLLVLAALAISGAALVNRNARVGLVLLTMAVVASPVPFYKMPHGFYTSIHLGSPGLEWDVYRAALELQHLVSRYPPSSGAAGFWYTNRMGSLLNSIQSMYLWGASLLALPGNPKAGMPALTDAALARLPLFRYLFLLGEQPEDIEQGKSALDAAGIKTRILDQASYDGKYFHMKYMILERLSNAVPPQQNSRATQFKPSRHRRVDSPVTATTL